MGFIFKRWIGWILFLSASLANADQSLCGEQDIVFSCSLGKKQVSLCHPKGDPKALSYRFGSAGNVELQYPKAPEIGHFYRQHITAGGGGREYVYFESEGYTYGIYAEFGRSANEAPHFEDGLRLLKKGEKVKTWVCKDGGLGFRDDINWLEEKQIFD